MIKYIHIGYPKTLTTSLQTSFFSKHSQLLHLGVGCGSAIDFIDDDINIALENYILYAKEIPYLEYEDKIKNAFDKWFKYAEKEQYRAVGISFEWLSFNMTPYQNDIVVIAERLKRIFGKETKIIALLRNQSDFLKSLYGQFVKEGLSLSFNDFIDFSYTFKDNNFLYSLFYDRTFTLYAHLFDEKNIHFIPIETIRDSKTKQLIKEDNKIVLLQKISDILNIDYEEFDLEHVNPSLSGKELFQKLKLNQKIRHDFGNLIFEYSNMHRNRKYFEKDPLINIKDPFFDVKKKRLLLEEAKSLSFNDQRTIDYYANPLIIKKLSKMFTESNKALHEKSRIELPDIYYLED